MPPVHIEVGDRYRVVVGAGVAAQIADRVPRQAQRVLVVHPEAHPQLARPICESLAATGLQVYAFGVPDGEAAKTAAVASHLWGMLGQEGFTRSDLVVGVGGGSVTDLAGFVAACWLRGVAVIQVPTTVLGMVDAAVGGKTGINTVEGKNLVGAFHEPVAVLCDTELLTGLPQPDVAAGMAEVIKCGFIADPAILDLVTTQPQAALDVHSPVMRELIERAITVKAQVVAADLKESALREILNYGHTLAHAIEQHEQYCMRHGDAVAIGCIYAAELAHRAGLLDSAAVSVHRSVLESVGLPIEYARASFDELLTVMRRDKKTRGSTLRFVVLTSIGHPTRLEGPSEELLRAAYDAIRGS